MEQTSWRENGGDLDGDTSLHSAAASGNYQQLFHGVSLGCDINSQNNFGWTPLMQAARKGHAVCVKLLLDFGAEVAIKNRFVLSSDTYYKMASNRDRGRKARPLSSNTDQWFSLGICALSLAAASGSLESVSFPISEIEKYFSPVFFAVLYNQLDVLRYLEKYHYSLTKTAPVGNFCPVVIAKILKYKQIDSFFERRGMMNTSPLSPLRKLAGDILIKSTPHSQKNLNVSPQIPIFLFSSPATSYTPLNDSKNTSFLIQLLGVKKRKSSNVLISPPSDTPNLSPIVPGGLNASRNSENSISTVSINSSNHMLNSRIKLRFSSTDDSNDSGAFFEAVSKVQEPKPSRSYSFNAAETSDDVFLPFPDEHLNRNKGFIELLRRNSLDSCITLFEKHEIDLDLFLALSESHLREIGVDWDKRNEVLEFLYQYNKKYTKIERACIRN